MLFISGIELPIEESEETAIAAALKRCGLSAQEVHAFVYKRAVDARRKNVHFSYTVGMESENEAYLAEKLSAKGVSCRRASTYDPEAHFGKNIGQSCPVVAGFGPAGAFAALMLAEQGYHPIVIERGGDVDERCEAVNRLHREGSLDPETNIQFGEGGAGTFSDGKLFTRIGDERCDYILKRMEALAEIPSLSKLAHPHVGTDKLCGMIKSVRRRIEACGGKVFFHEKLVGIETAGGKLKAVRTDKRRIACERLILACGHSARDTFEAMRPVLGMEPKGFAMGLRVEHLREDIDRAMYGRYAGHPKLGSAEYRLVAKTTNAFSFCMCPGGTVVAAASEAGGVVTNGMSEYARDGRNSNAAIVVPMIYRGNDPLGGIAWQRELENAAFRLGGGSYAAPVQTWADFLAGHTTAKPGRVKPTYPAGTRGADIAGMLPGNMREAIINAMKEFDRKVAGFAASDALFTAPETRTSSPVRILRGENMASVSVEGVYPCGEGAGYAGGILSAAVDGIKAAERSTQ